MPDTAAPDAAAALRAFLETREGEMTALLERLVNIDSNSWDKAGVDRVGEALADYLAGYGIETRRLPLEGYGEPFLAEIPGTAPGAPVLLMGHRDTVFPADETTRRRFEIRDGKAYGPGVADMKAGLVMNAVVTAALHVSGVPHPPIRCLFTGDEEIATPANRAEIEAQAKGARAVFNAEPGRISGNVVTRRRGGVFFKVALTGKAAHAGLDYESGRSAILALARKIEAWTGMTDTVADVTVNVGLVSGGQSVNTVAPWAEARIDLRYTAPGDREALIAKVREIAEAEHVPGTTGVMEIMGEFLPMAETPEQQALLAQYLDCARAAGLEIGAEHTRSCADSGITAALGVPTICATGPVGALAHSPDEYLLLDTMVPRSVALALTLAGMAAA